MFNWLKSNKPPPTAQDEEIPPQIRKPTHAYRDACMSIPIGEREFYDIIQARKRISSASSYSNGKGKARSPLAYSSGSTSWGSTPGSSERASHNGSSYGSKTSLTGGWAAAVAEEYARQNGYRQDGTELNSLAESSRDAVAREREGRVEE